MRKSILFGAVLLIASCTVQKEEEFENQAQHRYHAVAEEPVDAETRVFSDSKLRVRWNEGDHITIFERNTYNQEFEFLGDTGDTAGDFDPVESGGYHSSGDIEDGHVYAVYPYEKKNKCDFDGKLTVTFPSTQHYKKDSFGIGANVMVAKTNTMDLRFMHVGGYRTFKLYGEGVSVSSVRIESNGPEYLSGRADVVMGEDGKPEVSFVESTSNSKSVELVCDTPVALGGTEADAVEFWFVLPPGTLSQGFTVTITDINGNEFTKFTSNSIEIKSGVKKSMAAFEVEIKNMPISDGQQNNEIRYTTMDGNLLSIVPTAYSYLDDYDDEDDIETSLVSHEYVNGIGIMKFAHDIVLAGFEHYYSPNDGRDNLLTISFPSTMTRIGSFDHCSNLSSVTILGELQGQTYNPFTRCLNIETFEGPSAFTNWSGSFLVENKTAISFAPKGKASCNLQTAYIKTIGNGCFEGCSSLSSITLLDIQGIQSSAFRYCTNLQSVYLSGALEYIGNHAFEGCSNLSSVKFSSTYLSLIGESAFSGCISLKDIDLPSSLTTLRAGAFQGSGLTSIVIPASVSSIGDLCFSCQSMESATICSVMPPSLDWFDDDESYVYSAPFSSSPGMQQSLSYPIFIPKNSLSSYLADSQWSMYSSRLQAMDIIQFIDPAVKSICVANWDTNHDGELSQSEAEAVTSLGTVFKNTSITAFPELNAFSGLTTISNSAFYHCTQLSQIALPPTIVTIEESSFEFTINLQNIVLPSSLRTIQDNAFLGSNLSELWTLPSGVQTIGNYAFGSCKMRRMVLPDTVTSIGSRAFDSCSSMTSLRLPTSLSTIDDYTFNGTGITSLTIPESVSSIGWDAFGNCNSLTEINCLRSTPPTVKYTEISSIFIGNSNFTIYVSNTSAYRSAPGWSLYRDNIAYKQF